MAATTWAGTASINSFRLRTSIWALWTCSAKQHRIANVQLTMQPCERVKLLVWYYYLFCRIRTTLPIGVMTPFNPLNAPASRDLGHEIDLLARLR